MSEQRLDTIIPRPVLLADAVAGSREPAAGGVARESGELLDDDLEYVVGGLARVWIDTDGMARGAHDQPGA